MGLLISFIVLIIATIAIVSQEREIEEWKEIAKTYQKLAKKLEKELKKK